MSRGYRRAPAPAMTMLLRGLCGLLLALVPALPVAAQLESASSRATRIEVEAIPVQLDPEDITRTSIGELTYAGGLTLRSADANFGGLSGLLVDETGQNFIAISDRGTWFDGTLLFDRGELTGVAEVDTAPILDWRGNALSFANNDSEGLAWSPRGVLVSFEGFHRIWRYSLRSLAAPTLLYEQSAIAIEAFEGLADQPSNGGLEAIAALPGGGILAISEEGRTDDGAAQAWLITEAGAERLSLPVSDEFMPTDAAALANGDVLFLERRFSLMRGAAMRLRRISGASIRPGSAMAAETLAVIQPPMTVDNMEAVAAVPLEDGGYRLFIASDDNFNVLQRTLLLSFTWRPGD